MRWLRALPLLLISPILAGVPLLAIAVADLLWLLLKWHRLSACVPKANTGKNACATIVIPNWNGRDLLEKYLPSVIAAVAGNPANEILVVDNGSTDGSVELLRERFPQVRILALDRNLGFGGGSNAGMRAAKNDIVVLLNSDMRVAPDFLAPLLEGFTDGQVFAVSCQIFFSDPNKLREETGLTQGWWENGRLRVRHRIDAGITDLYPCFYGGGGSCAFDRRKFLELGGFDPLLAPFYLEDTDLGYMAWKRGWKVLYQPRSVVWHEHRGTIGKRFTPVEIRAVLDKNFILFSWKNIHEWPRLLSQFFFTYAGAMLAADFIGMWRAFPQLPRALARRWRARNLAAVSDTEAFRRPLGGYFRDRFEALPSAPEKLRVLFVSPYPICPVVHGGAVFMYQTIAELARLAELHLVILLDYPSERKAHAELERLCASVEYVVRLEGKSKALGSIVPHAVREFSSDDLRWLIHRQIQTRQIDVVQLEYTNMAQYAGQFRQIPCMLFEHDIYFQSIGRALANSRSLLTKLESGFEYLRALRWELRTLPMLDRVQACSTANRDYLISFLPQLEGRVDDNLRAGIDTRRYRFQPCGREPYTMLFLGSFRHAPNQEALAWFTRRVLPRVLERKPEARLVIVGAEPPPRHALPDVGDSIELRGFVDDVREPLGRYAVFVCPILSGSGMRVKLLEAFSAGIPTVSTRLGAEGLATKDGEFCALADDPEEFAGRILHLFNHPEDAVEMAKRARAEVEASFDMAAMTQRLVASYREAVIEKQSGTGFQPVMPAKAP